MLINVLVCEPDGNQVMEQREVDESYFVPKEEELKLPGATE